MFSLNDDSKYMIQFEPLESIYCVVELFELETFTAETDLKSTGLHQRYSKVRCAGQGHQYLGNTDPGVSP